MFGRMYMGAHLPLDLVGGAALGAIAGGVVNLVISPDPPRAVEGVSGVTMGPEGSDVV